MHDMTSRRGFLTAAPAVAAAGLIVPGTAQGHDAEPASRLDDYPRDHPGAGGPVGSPTDRGKLVPCLRAQGLPPVPVETPDLGKLPWVLRDGAKEFHLIAMPVKHEPAARRLFRL